MQKIKNYLEKLYFLKIHPIFFILPFIVKGLYRRADWRASHNLWRDEWWQVQPMNNIPFIEYVRSMPQREYCSYLSGDFYLIYPFYQIFGENKWGLAIPHIIITLIGFYLLFLICKKYMKSIWGYVIAFAIFSLNEELRIHAFEIRTYAVLPTLALASFYFQHKLILEPSSVTSKQRWGMGLFFFITILWHAYGVLITFIPTLYFLGTIIREQRIKNTFKDIVKFFLPVVILSAPIWLISVFGPHLPVHRYGTFEWTPNPAVDFVAFLKFIFGNLVGRRSLYFLLGGLVLAFLLPHPRRYSIMGFFLVLIALPMTLLFVMNVRSDYWFLQRQFIWVIPYFALGIALCWEAILEYFLGKIKIHLNIEK